MHREDEPAMKTLDPVNENVPRLEEYGTDLEDAYWDKWSGGAAVRAVQGEGGWPAHVAGLAYVGEGNSTKPVALA